MNMHALFTELRDAGVAFSLREDGTLRSRAPKGALTPEQRAVLQAHAPALLQVLRTELQGTPANHPEPWRPVEAPERGPRTCG